MGSVRHTLPRADLSVVVSSRLTSQVRVLGPVDSVSSATAKNQFNWAAGCFPIHHHENTGQKRLTLEIEGGETLDIGKYVGSLPAQWVVFARRNNY